MSLPSVRTSTSLPVALAHAVGFLTRSLVLQYPAHTTITLQRALEGALLPYYAASWVPAEPSRGAGRRCLTLAPGCTPPRPVFAACAAAGVKWDAWMETLGGNEFDLFVDPGRVAIRFACSQRTLVVWAAEPAPANQQETPARANAIPEIRIARTVASVAQAKAEVGAALRAKMVQGTRARAIRTLSLHTTGLTIPTLSPACLPSPATPPRRVFGHSRSSSASSAGSSRSAGSSLFSTDSGASESDATSVASAASSPRSKPVVRFALPPTPVSPVLPARVNKAVPIVAPPAEPAVKEEEAEAPLPSPVAAAAPYKTSRRERARQRRAGIVIDANADVTPYDGGKTTVLGGGVLLGGARAICA